MANGPIATAFVELKPKLSGNFESQVRSAISPALDRVSSHVDKTTADVSKSFDAASQKVEKSFDSAADAITADSKRAGDAIDRGLSDGASKAGNALGNLKGLVTGVATAAIVAKGVDFFGDAISSASDLGETLSKIETQIGGPAAAAVEKFANSAAKSLGQSRQEALDTIGTFNTFGKAAGLAGSDVADFSIKFDKLAVDLASFNNTSTGTAAEALGAALRGESEAIRQFGVLLNDDTLSAQALADGMIKPTKNAPAISKALKAMQSAQEAFNGATKQFGPDSAEAQAALDRYNAAQAAFGNAAKGNVPALTAQQKILATQASIFKQTADAQGDAERTGGALAGQQKRLSATFADAKQNIGALFLPAMSSVVSLLNDKLVPAAAGAGEALKKFGGFIGDNIDTIKKIATVIGVVLIPHLAKLAVQATISAATQVAAWVSTGAAAIASTVVSSAQVVLQIAKWIALGVAATANAAVVAAAWLISIGPIALVVAAIAGLAVVIVKNWDTIKDAFMTGARFVVDKFLGMVEWVIRGAASAFGWVPKIGDKLKEAAKDFEAFRDSVNRSLGGINDKMVKIHVAQKESGNFATAGLHAEGGIFSKATLGIFGEDGREAIVPLTKPARAAQLVAESGLLRLVAPYFPSQITPAARSAKLAASMPPMPRSSTMVQTGMSGGGPLVGQILVQGATVAGAFKTASEVVRELRAEAYRQGR